jgi:hypothetical protein
MEQYRYITYHQSLTSPTPRGIKSRCNPSRRPWWEEVRNDGDGDGDGVDGVMAAAVRRTCPRWGLLTVFLRGWGLGYSEDLDLDGCVMDWWRQGFAMDEYEKVWMWLWCFSLRSSPLYIGLGGPLGPPNTVHMTWENPRIQRWPK